MRFKGVDLLRQDRVVLLIFLQQSLCPNLKTLLPENVIVIGKNKFNTSSPDVDHKIQIMPEPQRSSYAKINVVRLLFTRDNINLNAGDCFYFISNILPVLC